MEPEISPFEKDGGLHKALVEVWGRVGFRARDLGFRVSGSGLGIKG